MVVVPAGRFTMGSPDAEQGRVKNEGPQHVVTIARPFAVSKFEVTRGEYARFVRATRHKSGDGCVVWTGKAGGEPVSGKSWRDPNFRQDDSHPVVCITWGDAKAYVEWLSRKTGKTYRFLSEAEWEYAARAGSVTRFHFGDDDDDLCKYANVADQSAREGGGGEDWKYANCRDGYGTTTAPVGSFLPNAFGLHDMHANVWEWMQDCYHDGYVGAPDDGSAWIAAECKARVVRGGSLSAPPRADRSAIRSLGSAEARSGLGLAAVPDWHNWNLGLRLARNLD
jgi:formylglycine-generating enzyme required for sulfatase activity